MKLPVLIFSLIFTLQLHAQVMWQFKKDSVITWQYSEGDEFNNNSINTNYWKYIGSARSLFANKEQQYYTDGQNHSIGNGSLKLTAKKDSVFKRTIDWMNDNDSLKSGKTFYSLNKKQFAYTAGKLITQKTFNKGFFECRFKLPQQKGYWPACWLFGGSPNEEIDMMECKTERPQQIHLDTHCGNKCDVVDLLFSKKSYGGWVKTDYKFNEGFNVVACDWNEKEVRFYLNGECIGVSNVKFDVAKNLVLNIAVPSDNGPFHPAPNTKDTSTAVFEIDYVRVWNKATGAATTKETGIFTAIDTLQPLITSSKAKPKGKLVYGKKSEHKDDGAFISCLQSANFIQLSALGIYSDSKPAFSLVESFTGKEILKGQIETQIFTIPTAGLPKGEYEIFIEWQGKQVKNKILLY